MSIIYDSFYCRASQEEGCFLVYYLVQSNSFYFLVLVISIPLTLLDLEYSIQQYHCGLFGGVGFFGGVEVFEECPRFFFVTYMLFYILSSPSITFNLSVTGSTKEARIGRNRLLLSPLTGPITRHEHLCFCLVLK